MTLLKHLKNEKSAQAETSAMQYPASQPDHTSIIPGHLIHTIIRPAFLLILLLFSSFSALAYDCKVDNIYYNLNNDDKTASVTNTTNNKYVGNIIIPESITYSGTTYSVTSIGEYAFESCSELTSVTIGKHVYSIGKYAFRGCSGLTSVVVDKNNGTYDSRDNCNAIIETSTNKLIVGCKNTTIPNSVTSIGKFAFAYCSGLTTVTIPNSVTTIGDYAFSGCTGLTSVTIPNSVTSIGTFAFYGCPSLTTVTIPNSVTSTGDGVFSGCSGLTTVTIPNSVTSIGQAAFSGCTGLTSVTIPNSVTSIGNYAFYKCTGLTNLTSLAVEPPTCGEGVFEKVDKTTCQLLVPEESINKYKTADQWKEFMNIYGFSGVDDVSVDTPDALYEVYNLQGVRVGGGMREAEVTADVLPHGVYILVSPQNRKKLKI